MDKLDLYAGVILTVTGLALVFFIIPMHTREGMFFGLPPTFFPQLLAWGMTACAVALTVQSALRLKAQGGSSRPMPLSWGTLGMFAILAGTVLVGIVAIDNFGMVWGAPALIAVLMLLLGDRNPIRIVATALIPVSFIYYLAIYVLQTPVP